MNRKLLLLTLFVMVQGIIIAQLTPWQAVQLMKRGINVGNTLETNCGETCWGNPKLVESNFDDYKNAGFTTIRIPVTWDFKTKKTSPYTIDSVFLARVEQVVDWALARGLIVILNAHHEAWIKDNFTEQNMARFDSIWAQISRKFKNKSDHLLFEIINEPYPMSLANVNRLNKQVLATIRKTNPDRIVLFSGHMWSNADELIQADIPDTTDTMLMGYYHSYDPYPFGLEGPGTFGSDADIAAVEARFQKVKNWSNQHQIPVLLGEFGATKKCEYNSRMCHYATIVDLALKYGVPFCAWDDGGDFKIYNRSVGTWNDIKDIIIYTYAESPNKLTIGNYADTLIKITWNNRTTQNDSIIIERQINSDPLFANSFVKYKVLPPDASSFIDSNVMANNMYYYYRIRTKINDSIEVLSYPVRLKNNAVVKKFYGSKPAEIPGIVEAENFDIGIEGIAYHDSDIENKGGKYRIGPGVDIYSSGSTYYISDLATDEWAEYTVNVLKTGNYQINASVSSTSDNGSFQLIFQNNNIITFQVEKTDGIVFFKNISQNVQLDSGIQVMRLKIIEGDTFGINRFSFTFLTSISENELNKVTIFPNPATEFIRIKGINDISQVKIYNVCGVLIRTHYAVEKNQNINISDLPSGIYLLQISSGSSNHMLRMIKK